MAWGMQYMQQRVVFRLPHHMNQKQRETARMGQSAAPRMVLSAWGEQKRRVGKVVNAWRRSLVMSRHAYTRRR